MSSNKCAYNRRMKDLYSLKFKTKNLEINSTPKMYSWRKHVRISMTRNVRYVKMTSRDGCYSSNW